MHVCIHLCMDLKVYSSCNIVFFCDLQLAQNAATGLLPYTSKTDIHSVLSPSIDFFNFCLYDIMR